MSPHCYLTATPSSPIPLLHTLRSRLPAKDQKRTRFCRDFNGRQKGMGKRSEMYNAVPNAACLKPSLTEAWPQCSPGTHHRVTVSILSRVPAAFGSVFGAQVGARRAFFRKRPRGDMLHEGAEWDWSDREKVIDSHSPYIHATEHNTYTAPIHIHYIRDTPFYRGRRAYYRTCLLVNYYRKVVLF